jgi:acetyl-CoA carboxylase carboxyl transferase subunit beta
LEFVDLQSYRERLREARRETGLRDAVTTGLCRIEGHRAVLIVFDFDFLGGTMGSVAGEKIALKLGIIDVVVPEPEGGAPSTLMQRRTS